MQNPIKGKLTKYYQDRLKFINKNTKIYTNPLLKPSLRLLVSKSLLEKKGVSEKNKPFTQKISPQRKKSSLTSAKNSSIEAKQPKQRYCLKGMRISFKTEVSESKRYTIDQTEENKFFDYEGQKFRKYSQSCQNFYKKQKINGNNTTIQSDDIFIPTKKPYKRHKRLYSAMPHQKQNLSITERSQIINEAKLRHTIRQIPKQQILLGWEIDKIQGEHIYF